MCLLRELVLQLQRDSVMLEMEKERTAWFAGELFSYLLFVYLLIVIFTV
jgi:hypothetical protein